MMTATVNRAFLFALRVHGEQVRKDGKPYIVHPFSVAMQLTANGADDALICAGLLHDTIEDGGVSPEELRAAFGDEVLRLILFDTEDKALSWRERKEATLRTLGTCDRPCAMLICADKLSNLRDMEEGLESVGDAVWHRFRHGAAEQEWLFRECVRALAPLADLPMYNELKQEVETVFPKRGREE